MITINGKNYEQKEVQQKKSNLSPKMNMLMMMAMAFSGNSFGGTVKAKGECNVDIVKEFGLIQLKKSNLSRSQRDLVVFQFNKHFVEVVSSNNA